MAQGSGKLTPRQKMINLMYIVLTAMLALNVSSDVLDGFIQVEDGLSRTNINIEERNSSLYTQLEDFNKLNPEKGGVSFSKATEVVNKTEALYSYIDSLKTLVVKRADGKDGDVDNIKRLDDIEAAAIVMLPPSGSNGEQLRNRITNYREYISSLMTDNQQKSNIETALATNPVREEGTLVEQTWETSLFEHMPVVAAVTLLSKIQSDVRYAEGEALNQLINQIDAKDVRVNKLDALVIPTSKNIMRGSKYTANIVLAAVDTTQRPTLYIDNKRIDGESSIYEFVTSRTGVFDYKGYLELPNGNGESTKYPFESTYTVIEPIASVSATMMNVLYAGIDNPITIAVPGVTPNNISATMTNGSLSRSANGWIAKPTKVGSIAVVTVTANIDGRSQTVASTEFRVRRLPDPMPYIEFTGSDGNVDRYKGSKPFAKQLLLSAEGISAAIDDDLLNVNYKVLSFETIFFDSMGNAIPEVSDGANFSARQKNSFRRLTRGKRFYVSRVNAIGPDGIERILSPMEVIIN